MASFSLSTVKTNSHRFKIPVHVHRLTASYKYNGTPGPDDDDRKLRTSIGIQSIDRRTFILGLGSLTLVGTFQPQPAFAQTETAHGKLPVKVEDMELPVKLDQTVKVLVKRPAVNRSKEDKEKANEILMVSGVNVNSEKFVKFDVMVNVEDDESGITPADSEFAGSFALLPYRHGQSESGSGMTRSGARFGLTELLEDIKAEDDEYVLVSLVPRTGCEDATVSEIKIELVPVD